MTRIKAIMNYELRIMNERQRQKRFVIKGKSKGKSGQHSQRIIGLNGLWQGQNIILSRAEMKPAPAVKCSNNSVI